MRIGEASIASGVPERMIRHYEKLGLIPAPSRRASGYRVYGDDDVRRLRFIARARRLAFDMAEISGFMAAWGTDGHEAVAGEWRTRIAEKAADLAALSMEVER